MLLGKLTLNHEMVKMPPSLYWQVAGKVMCVTSPGTEILGEEAAFGPQSTVCPMGCVFLLMLIAVLTKRTTCSKQIVH